MILYGFINCPAFVDIKQTLRYKLAMEYVIRETVFLCIVPYFFFAFFRWIKFCSCCFMQVYFHLGVKKVVAGRVR